ncbi:MAG: cupredoxin domain-containing protein [Chloroflexi bacterium]|nr:cupredoxin domain-containing protein [Chloroflexota bacterium]
MRTWPALPLAGIVLTACGLSSTPPPLPTTSARPIIVSSTNTPGPNAPPTSSGPAVPNSTVLTPFVTPTPAAPTATALLTVVAGNQVRIVDFNFDPPSSTASIGNALTWTNTGPSNHTVTADDGSFDSGPILVNAKFSFTPTKPGTFAYHCSIHPTMHGTLLVN